MLLLLVACTDAPSSPKTTVDPTVCVDRLTLTAPPDPAPGRDLGLFTDPAPPGDYVWEAEIGEILPGDPGEATWTVPGDVAVDLAETTSVTVTLSMAGCAPVVAAADVTLRWPQGERVVVIYDPLVEGSAEVATAYAEFRDVPPEQLCAVSASDPTTIPGAELDSFLAPILLCLADAGPQIHYLVPVYGVPYRVTDRIADLAYGTPTTTSLDALLVFGALAAELDATVDSRLYQDGDSMAADYAPYVPVGELFDAINRDYYLVARIDGADPEAALDLIARTALAESVLAETGQLSGTVYVDGNRGDTPPTTDDFGSYESGEWNMWGTRAVFEADGRWPVVWDGNEAEFGTAPAPLTCPDALFYAGWYSFNHYNDAFTWSVGAVGGHLDSCSACDIRAGDAWSANALQKGITATFGAVNEPYVAGMPEYDQLFYYLLSGATFGEAAYESTRIGAWMQVFVGDPLYRPVPG